MREKMADSYVIDGYVFRSQADYERAKKERETIFYLSAHSDMEDMKAVYKIYKTASEKQSFQTIFGLKYMEELRKRIIDSGIVTEDVIDPIPVGRVVTVKAKTGMPQAEKKAEEYKQEYEKAKSGSIIKNLLIAVLLFVVVGMLVITYNNQYSVFTYFTNYKENMRGELLDEYEDWESALKEREQAVEKRERELGMTPEEDEPSTGSEPSEDSGAAKDGVPPGE